MPVTDLFAASRRILRKLLGRSRHIALAASLIPLGAVGASTAEAAPIVQLPPEFPATPFSMRVTDLECVPGDAEGDAFRIELEFVNWTSWGVDSLIMAANNGNSGTVGSAPHLVGASVDADGRGGPPGGSDIGPGAFDPVAIHNGQGRGDIPGYPNNWRVMQRTESLVRWDTFDASIPNQPWHAQTLSSHPISAALLPIAERVNMVPGFGVDGLGDSAFDGGPEPYSPATPGSGIIDNFNEWYNSLDGFVIDIDNWDEGEAFSLNWYLAALFTNSGGAPYSIFPISQAGLTFTYGVMNLVRVDPTIGSAAASLPGPVFVGNTGFDQSGLSFYGAVYEIPNPVEFAAEFGAGLTAPFLNPADNIFNLPINTNLVPEPSCMMLVGSGLIGVTSTVSRKRRNPK